MSDQFPRSERGGQQYSWKSIIGIDDPGPGNPEIHSAGIAAYENRVVDSGDDRRSVYSEEKCHRAYSEYDEERYHYPPYRADTSVSGQGQQHPHWRDVVGLPVSEAKGQSRRPEGPSMSYPSPSFQGRSAGSFGGASGQPPYYLDTSVNNIYMARDRPPDLANTSMSYPASQFSARVEWHRRCRQTAFLCFRCAKSWLCSHTSGGIPLEQQCLLWK